MKNLLLTLFPIVFFSCNNATSPDQDDTDTLKHSDVFNGVYSGVTPCADCPGINMLVIFSPDSIFYETLEYLERDTKFSDTGKWEKADSIITVKFSGKPDQQNRQFKILNDSAVAMLDGNGNIITGPLAENYILKKADTVAAR